MTLTYQYTIKTKEFTQGLQYSAPIILGYLPVGFAFGVVAVKGNINPLIAVLISLSSFTGAGQFAGATLIMMGSPLIEIGITMFIINIRYILMSLSLGQKISPEISLPQRFLIAFGITDEVFTFASLRKGEISFNYMSGMITGPYIGWCLGTFLGSFLTCFLPDRIQSAMGIALYAMFLALIIPESKKSKPAFSVIIIAVICSTFFKYIPTLSQISSGYVIIISSIIASGIGAYLYPREDEL